MTDLERLPCGAAVDDLITQVADGDAGRRTPHQGGCPHCQASLAEYQRLWAPVQDLADQHVQAPDGILEHVMAAIRTAGEHTGYGLLPSPLGITRIAGRVVAILARTVAESVPGVRAALAEHATSTADGHRGLEAIAGVRGTSSAIQLTLAVSYGQDLIALADRSRATVAARIRALTGLEPVEITIVIDDVLDLLD